MSLANIRRATPADAATIAAIWNPIIRDTLATFNAREKTTPELEHHIAAHPSWVCEDGTGFACLTQFRGGVGYAYTHEHTIYLTPEARGKGLGRALMDTVETYAKTQGYGSLVAGVSGANPDGIAFHTAIGFAKVGHIPKAGYKFDRWLDLVLLQKIL